MVPAPYACSKIFRGTLPGRKPGSLAFFERRRNARSSASRISSAEIGMTSSTWVGASLVRVEVDRAALLRDGGTALFALEKRNPQRPRRQGLVHGAEDEIRTRD